MNESNTIFEKIKAKVKQQKFYWRLWLPSSIGYSQLVSQSPDFTYKNFHTAAIAAGALHGIIFLPGCLLIWCYFLYKNIELSK